MKYIFQILIISIIPSAFAQETPADLGVAAIGYVVSDIEKSEKFYTEILGMLPAGSFSLDEAWSAEAGAANGRPFSVKMFRMADTNTATILKLAYFDSIQPRPAQSGIDAYVGVNYLTLNYNDLEAVASRIKKAGIEIVGWVKRDSYQLFFVRDPDGQFVELVGPPDR